MPGEQTPDTTDPKGSAAGGGSEGGSSSADNASGGKATESSGSTSSDDVKALKAENDRLQKELARATGKAGSDKATLEGRLAAVETKLQQAESEAASLKREKKANATADAIVAQLPEPHRALARRVVLSYAADGLDLAADDQPATVKTALERLGKEFAHLTTAPVDRPTVPRIPSVVNGQGKPTAEGLTVHGVKVV